MKAFHALDIKISFYFISTNNSHKYRDWGDQVANTRDVEVQDGSEDLLSEAAGGVGHGGLARPHGQLQDVAEVGVGLAAAASRRVPPVLPPDLHLLAAEAGEAGHGLHLGHGEEGQVVEPPGEQRHRLAAVGAPTLLGVPLALGPLRERGHRQGGAGGLGGGQGGGQAEGVRAGGYGAGGLRPLCLHTHAGLQPRPLAAAAAVV